ncbi:kinase-like domain-containing protein [Rhizophagus diaphanus]|nr:kinase-like domain-containing protein [Rhizophagus diaphanus] [Rhizophagus sp. MUCL 43196]
MISPNEWIDNKIKDDDINYFEYNEFSNMKKIDNGAFGIVNRADWKSCRSKVALKILASNSSINEDNMNKFLKELKNLRKVNFHPNINRCFGITKEPSSNNYVMVLHYANQGNLRDYLKDNFASLQWKDKIQMALDITLGLKCLHSREIIHRDLHAKNILVNDNKLMIADLGLSKQTTVDVTSISKIYGMPAYVEPQCYKTDNYVRNKKSDVYSLGVLLWEISSGYPPFSTIPIQILGYKIAMGYREQPIIDTPSSYVDLYQKCWDDNPDLRPTIDDVFDILNKISLEFNTDNEDYSEITDNNYSETQSQSSKSSDFQISTPLSSVSFDIENERKSSISSDFSQTGNQTDTPSSPVSSNINENKSVNQTENQTNTPPPSSPVSSNINEDKNVIQTENQTNTPPPSSPASSNINEDKNVNQTENQTNTPPPSSHVSSNINEDKSVNQIENQTNTPPPSSTVSSNINENKSVIQTENQTNTPPPSSPVSSNINEDESVNQTENQTSKYIFIY